MCGGTWRTSRPRSILRSFGLAISGVVNRTIELTLDDLTRKFERFDIVAVTNAPVRAQLLRSSRAWGAWANRAMGNARWTGVRLKDLLDYAGVRAGPCRCASAASM